MSIVINDRVVIFRAEWEDKKRLIDESCKAVAWLKLERERLIDENDRLIKESQELIEISNTLMERYVKMIEIYKRALPSVTPHDTQKKEVN